MLHDPPTSSHCPHPHDPSTSSHYPHPHDPPTSSHRHNNLAMPRRPKGPAYRLASANPISPSTPFLFLPSSRQYTAPTGIRARTSLGGGSLEEPSRNPVKRPHPEARRRVTPTTMSLSPKNAKNLPGRSLHRKGFFYSHRLIKPVLFLLTQQALQSPLRR